MITENKPGNKVSFRTNKEEDPNNNETVLERIDKFGPVFSYWRILKWYEVFNSKGYSGRDSSVNTMNSVDLTFLFQVFLLYTSILFF